MQDCSRAGASGLAITALGLVLGLGAISCGAPSQQAEPSVSGTETGRPIATATAAPPASSSTAALGAPITGEPGAPPTEAPPTEAPSPAAKTAPQPPPIPPSTAVLHVGDSMVPSLARGLRPRFRELGVRYEVKFEQSTFTSTWAGRMDALVAATQPHLVIVTLGGNEIGTTQPEAHARFVRRIVKAAAGRPCVWTTPPLWRGESGIFDVIQKNAAPCRFFETDRFLQAPIERVGDKIHPTPAGGDAWAGVFWPWLMQERVGGETTPWALRLGPAEEYAPRGLREAPRFAL